MTTAGPVKNEPELVGSEIRAHHDPTQTPVVPLATASDTASTVGSDTVMGDGEASAQEVPIDSTRQSSATGPEIDMIGVDATTDTTDNQLDVLGRPVKKLVTLINELQQLGVDTKDIPLPKIVVVGDQSAGKSSLIEGISGIRVPRSSGTCTRCPLQITLTSSDDTDGWSCKVVLQKKYTFRSDANKKGRYGKWSEDATPTDSTFAVLNDKSKLEDILRRAQWATLNPDEPAERYLKSAGVSDLPLKVEFSPNIIRLDITDHGLPNLSFIDLPGIIRQTAVTENEWLVSLVENFVTDYIKQGNSLILLARSMESDFANSSAAALIQKCRAIPRTIGCLTKPDRFPRDDPTESIHRVLNGDTFQVGYGYFVAKQPSQGMLDRDISNEEARQHEDDFFRQAPWATEFSDHVDRFGTLKLQHSLAVKLVDQILLSLPTITAKVNERLQAVEGELVGYPEPPTNAQGHVLESLNAFALSVDKHVHGVHSGRVGLRNSLKHLAKKFHIGLNELRPGLIVQTPKSFRLSNRQVDTISLLSDDDMEGDKTPCPTDAKPNPQKRKRGGEATPASARKVKLSPLPDRTAAMTPGKKSFNLTAIRETLQDLAISDVPNEVDPRAVDYLRKQTLEAWEQPMLAFIDSVTKEIQESLGQILEDACIKWRKTEFFTEASAIVKSWVNEAMVQQLVQSKRALNREQRHPFTLNDEGYKYHTAKEYEVLMEGRTTQRAFEKLEADECAANKMFDYSERRKKAKTDNKTRDSLGPDPFEQEIKVMASVRGYHDIAQLRFLDNVVHGIHSEVLHDVITKLPQQLKNGLQVETEYAQDYCSRLLAEDRKREVRRMELKKERENLVVAQHKLARLSAAE